MFAVLRRSFTRNALLPFLLCFYKGGCFFWRRLDDDLHVLSSFPVAVVHLRVDDALMIGVSSFREKGGEVLASLFQAFDQIHQIA